MTTSMMSRWSQTSDRLKYFGINYVTVIPKLVYRSTLGIIISPRKALRFLEGVLENDLVRQTDPVLGSKRITEILDPLSSGFIDVDLRGNFYDSLHGGTEQLLELGSIAFLIKSIGPRKVFEVGTYVGRTTRLLAMNAGSDATIFTLDLPKEGVKHLPGQQFIGRPEERQIRQLFGDSKEFDFTPFENEMDFVWVDGCHTYDWVIADTQAAFRMVRVGGWIAWHDYRHNCWWSDVTRAIRKTNADIGGGIVHLNETTIAVTQVSMEAKRQIVQGRRRA